MNVMDIDSFREEMDYDNETILLVLNELIKAIEQQLPYMKTLLGSGDMETLRREAHSIKGGARNIMADSLAYKAENLEKSVNGQSSSEILSNIGDLERSFIEFKDFVELNF